jgi:beta-1,2-mannobiose phosphorylase / 1,2-beta-oligomannan phosphorylase
MLVERYSGNPIITPEDVPPSRSDLTVWYVINAGVARVGDEVLLLLRVAEQAHSDDPGVLRVPYVDPQTLTLSIQEFSHDDPTIGLSDPRWISTPEQDYLSSISHLRLARSRDGLHFTVDQQPALFAGNAYETYGVEDARITQLADTYYINYTSVSPTAGVTTSLASTQDFHSFERHGVIFPPDNKDVTIFPARIHNRYYALHRPTSGVFGTHNIWIAESPDLLCWGRHRLLLETRAEMWDAGRVGGGSVPFLIDEGWLEIYHGADTENRYALGAVLLDRNEPWRILARSKEPIMVPEADYELHGVFSNVVFTCGTLCEKGVLIDDRVVRIYYGAADTVMAYAEIKLEDILVSLGYG